MENLDNALNSLSGQTKKINIALHYVGGDMEKAKQMVANSYQDMLAVKCKFSSSTLYGVFLLFFNYVYCRLDDSYWVVSADYTIDNISNTSEWKIFEKDIDEARNKGDDSRLSNDFKEKFSKAFTVSVGKKIYEYIKNNDSIQLNHYFQKYLQETTGLQRIDLNIDQQQITSLDMEENSISSKKLEAKVLEGKKEEKTKKEAAQKAEDNINRPPEVGKAGVKMIINSTLILSPIKGKHITQLVVGDRIMTTLIDPHPQTIEIAKAFNAYNDENKKISPIPARLKWIKYHDGIGYDIYAVIAKGIVVHIQEEESNIKVSMDPSYVLNKQAEEDEAASKKGLPLIIGLIAAVLVLVGVIVIIIFK